MVDVQIVNESQTRVFSSEMRDAKLACDLQTRLFFVSVEHDQFPGYVHRQTTGNGVVVSDILYPPEVHVLELPQDPSQHLIALSKLRAHICIHSVSRSLYLYRTL